MTFGEKKYMKKAVIANIAAIALLFFLWCTLDYIIVKSSGYPDNVRRWDWLIWIAPCTFIPLNIALFRHQQLLVKVIMIIAASALSLFALHNAVIYLGMPFHFYIGGEL